MTTDPYSSLLDPDPLKAEQAFNDLRRRLIFRFQHNLSSEAEDLAQEVIVRVLEKVRNLKKAIENTLTADDVIQFSFGVARNVAMEGPRRKQWGGRTEGLPPGLDRDERVSSRGPNPEERTIENERWDLVLACLQTLAAPRRELLLSWYLEENTAHKDLALRLGTNDNGLRIRIHRILECVRECVGKRVAKKRI